MKNFLTIFLYLFLLVYTSGCKNKEDSYPSEIIIKGIAYPISEVDHMIVSYEGELAHYFHFESQDDKSITSYICVRTDNFDFPFGTYNYSKKLEVNTFNGSASMHKKSVSNIPNNLPVHTLEQTYTSSFKEGVLKVKGNKSISIECIDKDEQNVSFYFNHKDLLPGRYINLDDLEAMDEDADEDD